MGRTRAIALMLALLASSLAGCSAFNMTPPCSEMSESLALSMIPSSLIPAGETIDRGRVAQLVRVTGLTELTAGYNQRTCQGQLALADGSVTSLVRFEVEQSEGAQGWHEIRVLNVDDPQLAMIVEQVRAAYVEGMS